MATARVGGGGPGKRRGAFADDRVGCPRRSWESAAGVVLVLVLVLVLVMEATVWVVRDDPGKRRGVFAGDVVGASATTLEASV